MEKDVRDRTALLRRLAWAAAGLAFGLVVLGGWVRISGSGLGCGDHWPRCNGHWLPPLSDIRTVIEFGHRWVAALVSTLVLAVTAVAWLRHRRERPLVWLATAALTLLVIQVLLGAVTVKLMLPPWVIITHLANAMLLLAVLMILAMRARAGGAAPVPAVRHRDHALVHLVSMVGFVVILYGAQVANFGAGLLCQGFPLCDGRLAPPASAMAMIHWTHRVLAFSFVGLVLFLGWRVMRRHDGGDRRALRRAVAAIVVLAALQVGVAAAMVLSLLPPALRVLHLLTGTAIWAALVVLSFVSSRTGEPAPAGAPVPPSRMKDYLTLTKPRIISLLLLTTIAPMFITDRGIPPLSLVLWVAVAGYLMAGGANAINMWFDRDIDTRMTRTKLRPIASGRISPAAGLAFGVGLGALSFAIFWFMVNPLSAWLALAGLLFYVFIYTMWLKRTTTQNIVIGGAAGAFPPLVGWAAVTGRIDLAAIYLFAIIFYWTPPHFWALALIKQGEYAKAGVPMMPVVRGERRTKVEMLLYTLFLVPLTVMPALFGALGPFYLAAALILGGRLLWYCVQLLREPAVTPTAWKMYKFSLLYLALLFVAMGIDRALPSSRRARPDQVIILRHPGQEFTMPAATPDR
jgi:protoheme IX farnesyltransferase